MPIKFYKTIGVPTSTFPNSEEVHFSDSGYIYIADKNGAQAVMYKTAIDQVTKTDSKTLSFRTIGGIINNISLDFYTTVESNDRYITQSNPMIGDYEIYHEGNQPPGLMSDLEKQKLFGIAPQAEVNQLAYSTIKFEGTSVSATTKTDSIEFLAGNNISFTVDQQTKKVTLNAILDSSVIGPIDNIDDVQVFNPTNRDILMYHSDSGLWKNGDLILERLYFKSQDGSGWTVGVSNAGQLYVESANIIE